MGILPDFHHSAPHFVQSSDRRLFELQAENTESMRANWVDWSWETTSWEPCSAKLVGGEGWSFQHFFDNLLPSVWTLAQIAPSSCVVEIDTPRDEILREIWPIIAPNWTFARVQKSSVIIEHLPTDSGVHAQVRVHPKHIQWLREQLLVVHDDVCDTLVFVSRKFASHGRRLPHEEDIIRELNHSFNVVVHDKSQSLRKELELFGRACAIVGAHGGGLYNQMFARKHVVIVELMPVSHKGLLAGQINVHSQPKIAHRAIWHNANLIGQKYWRIHYETSVFPIVDPTADIKRALVSSHALRENAQKWPQ
jgi:capsular polysaccharide biosynthesis protein